MSSRKNIVWIASYPKSGNTWFRVLLSNALQNQASPININEIKISNIASNRTLFDSLTGVNASDLSTIEIESLRPLVYRKLSKSSDETLYLKVHDAWTLNNKGFPLFPEDVTKSVIYIIRNPLDVAVSLAYHNSETIETALNKLNQSSYGLCIGRKRLSNQLPQKLLSWSEHVLSWVRHSNLMMHVIRYEDMYLNPLNTFSAALEFLEIPISKNELNKYIAYSNMTEMKKQEELEGFTVKPINAKSFFRKGTVFDWKNYISEITAKSFLEKNKEVFEMFYDEGIVE